jgi:hypothetical protein
MTVSSVSSHTLTCNKLEDTVISLYKSYSCYGCYASMWWCTKLDFVSEAINMLNWAICHGWTTLSLNHWGEKGDYFDSLELLRIYCPIWWLKIIGVVFEAELKSIWLWNCYFFLFLAVSYYKVNLVMYFGGYEWSTPSVKTNQTFIS